MKIVATGLLLVMARVFLAARALEHAYPWLGYVKAFAEAAMVGGLADWFAVTALFRHPLGLPIPHTAIIPRNKDRIGEALASFIHENFLVPVGRRPAHAAARRRRRRRALPSNSCGEGTRIRAGASRLIADISKVSTTSASGALVKGAISTRLRKRRSAVARSCARVGDQRGPARADARGGDPLDGARAGRERAADPRHGSKKANWALKLAGLDTKLADAIIDGLRKLTAEMSTDPAHPVRVKVEEALARFERPPNSPRDAREGRSD